MATIIEFPARSSVRPAERLVADETMLLAERLHARKDSLPEGDQIAVAILVSQLLGVAGSLKASGA